MRKVELEQYIFKFSSTLFYDNTKAFFEPIVINVNVVIVYNLCHPVLCTWVALIRRRILLVDAVHAGNIARYTQRITTTRGT